MKTHRIACSILVVASLALVASVPAWSKGKKAKPRVFIKESQSWEVEGGGGGASVGDVGAFGGKFGGGARPQTAEIIKTFHKRCSDCIVTMKEERANYVVILEHEGGKDLLRKDNKFVVFREDGDAIKSGSTRSLGNAVKEACRALMRDWKESREEKEE